MSCYYMQYFSDSDIFRIFPMVNFKDGVYFAMLFTLRESRRTSDPVLLRVRSKKTTTSPSDALTLKPSGFCNSWRADSEKGKYNETTT